MPDIATFTVPAGMFQAATKAEANALARAYANSQLPRIRLCCDVQDIFCCANSVLAEMFQISIGESPFTWEIIEGELPDGITLSFLSSGQTAVFSGTPTTPGNVTLTLRITSGSGAEIEKTFEFQVAGIIDTTLPEAQVGVAYSHQLTAIGGSGSYYFELTAGELPAGLNLSTSGLISGTPTSAEMQLFTISLSDQAENDPIEVEMVSTLQPAYMTATVQFLPHVYAIQDFATIFADPPDPPADTFTVGPVWDGNFGDLYEYLPGYRYEVCFPNLRKGTAGLWHYTSPVEYWMLYIWCEVTSSSPPTPETILWSGRFNGPVPVGAFTRISGVYTNSTLTVYEVV